jgi:hypothetical protein
VRPQIQTPVPPNNNNNKFKKDKKPAQQCLK